MNTAYRVWDGEEMYYYGGEGLQLVIKNNGGWELRRQVHGNIFAWITDSTNENAALMWGTGLKDKNGKMIYEYDIDMIDNEPMIVARAGGKFGLKYPADCDYHIDDCIDWEECNIGGNVYQNPELLEGAE
ncbi:YopX family protein [Bacillus stercoris]|uniref:YopX family protein n=1 Tax=Bacillus stercoris TaxID=2054641 RepID=UPI00403495D6